MNNQRPIRREKNVTGSSDHVYKRGSGLGSGPVGSSSGGASGGGRGSSGSRGRKSPLSFLIIIIAVVLFGGGGSLIGLSGGGSGVPSDSELVTSYSGSNNESWGVEDNAAADEGILDTSVAENAHEKRTTIAGNGNDTITMMVYLCGTDLESKSGQATKDIQEMVNSELSDKINLLIYTGGCKNWKNNIVSNKKNQIYQVTSKGLTLLGENDKLAPMTDPATLASFIQFGKEKFPADRYDLILWDHGGGSVSAYGYDEVYAGNGSMTLDKVGKALKDGGCTFDFIGFDACLMATLETALVVEPYADYLIASEETEPGCGWYYTNWLTKLSKNTSMPTTEIGKNIIDDFVKVCGQSAMGQKATLSITDLAELSATVPDKFKSFADSTTEMLNSEKSSEVLKARADAKEFAQSSRIDQVDFIDFAEKLGTQEAVALADALKGAVKYNKTSSNINNAYGMSIYFPYRKTGTASRMAQTYKAIGIDDSYTKCIQAASTNTVGGQVAAGGQSAQLESLFGSLLGGVSSSQSGGGSSSQIDGDVLSQLLGAMLQGRDLSNVGLDADSADILDAETIESNQDIWLKNRIDTEALVWTEKDGKQIMKLKEDQWNLIRDIELNVFVDDGEGYIDLGLDNVYEFDDKGNLVADYDNTWMAIDGHIVAYYMLSAVGNQDDYTIMGRVPALLNGQRVNLVLSFTDENPYGEVLGGEIVYSEDETDTQSKGLIEINDGDEIDFLCDYYDYDRNYTDSYYLGEPLTVNGNLEVSNMTMDNEDYVATYRITDIYQNHYWTPAF